jgi:Protein of unknown function (DUF3606)
MTFADHLVIIGTTSISLKEASDAEFWCRRFGVEEAELRLAMRAVGVRAEDVERHLARQLEVPRWGERWNDSASLTACAQAPRNTPSPNQRQHPRLKA